MGIQNAFFFSNIASHGLDFGVGAGCAAFEGLALYGASQYKNPVSVTEKFKKYTLIALAILAGIGATFAGSIALGGTTLKLCGLQAAELTTVSTALFSILAHVQAFTVLLKPEQDNPIP